MAAVEITDADVRRARHAYYGEIAYVDDQVGRLLATLERFGLRQDTVVLFTADHGEMLGERGLWFKMHFFEWALRVPLIVSAPGRFGVGRVAAPVSLVDVMPTLLALAGGAGEAVLAGDGRSLVPALAGGALTAAAGARGVHRRGYAGADLHGPRRRPEADLERGRPAAAVRSRGRSRRIAQSRASGRTGRATSRG